ncbi:MAG: hypothetical protein V8Q54_08225 [Alistipes senegalensis]
MIFLMSVPDTPLCHQGLSVSVNSRPERMPGMLVYFSSPAFCQRRSHSRRTFSVGSGAMVPLIPETLG